MIINYAIGPKERTVLCQIRKALWANDAPYELIKNTTVATILSLSYKKMGVAIDNYKCTYYTFRTWRLLFVNFM